MDPRLKLDRPALRRAEQLLLPPARLAASVSWTAGVISTFYGHRSLALGTGSHELRQRYKRAWAWGLLRILGAELAVVPGVPPPPARGRFVVANHRTAFDIPLLMALFGGGILARGDMSRWPFAGWAAREGETIFVDRRSAESRTAAIEELRQRLAAGGSVSVFSEGTTYAGDEVRPFHPGAFRATTGLDIDLVPVGIAYPPGCEFTQDAFLQHVGELAQRRRIRIAVCIGRAQSPEGDAEAIATYMRDAVQELVHRARKLL